MKGSLHSEQAADGNLTRREFLIGSAGSLAGLLVLGLSSCSGKAQDPPLEILRQDYPQTFSVTNNREPLGDELTLRAKDGLFVMWSTG